MKKSALLANTARAAHRMKSACMSSTMLGANSLLGVTGTGLSGKYCLLIFCRREVGVRGNLFISQINNNTIPALS
jgi:hypothetical protein